MRAAILVTGLGAATGSMLLVGLLTVLGTAGPGVQITPAASPRHAAVAAVAEVQPTRATRVAEGG